MTGHGGYREGNPTYRLDPESRRVISTMVALGLWSATAIANAVGVHRKTVRDCAANYVPLG